jgi:hypothetical protein
MHSQPLCKRICPFYNKKIFNIFVVIFLTTNLLQYNVQYTNEITTCNFHTTKDSRGCATTRFLTISDVWDGPRLSEKDRSFFLQ